MKTKREHLEDHNDAFREIEYAEIAIGVLERMRSAEASRSIKMLQRVQQRQLRIMDRAAAALGAPYGAQGGTDGT